MLRPFLELTQEMTLHVTCPFARRIRLKTYQFRRFESANYACAVDRCCMEFLRLYSDDKEGGRPSGSSTEARKFVGICLVQRCERRYLLAGEK